MRNYMGVVFDIGHQAVGYEDIPASLQKLVDAGMRSSSCRKRRRCTSPT